MGANVKQSEPNWYQYTEFEIQTFNKRNALHPYFSYFQGDCEWSDFAKTGECTKSCGGGTQFYTRSIIVQPRNGGNPCSGSPTKQESCNTQRCPRRF